MERSARNFMCMCTLYKGLALAFFFRVLHTVSRLYSTVGEHLENCLNWKSEKFQFMRDSCNHEGSLSLCVCRVTDSLEKNQKLFTHLKERGFLMPDE